MELTVGTVVKSTAGKDSGEFFAVVALSDKNVLLCDGRKRPLSNFKSKNIKHIEPTGYRLSDSEMATNREFRRAIRKYTSFDA